MEKNMQFETQGLESIVVHLAWAQLEAFADDVEKIQVLVAGDEHSVADLRLECKDGTLLVEQPQYGISVNGLMDGKWMQICVRMPRAYGKDIFINTISGLLSARGLHGENITLETVSGDQRVLRLEGKTVKLKTVSGDIRVDTLRADELSIRTVSGDVTADSLTARTVKGNGISGEQKLRFSAPFQKIDVNSVSGDVMIATRQQSVSAVLHSISGQVRTEGVSIAEGQDYPTVRLTGVSADLILSVKD